MNIKFVVLFLTGIILLQYTQPAHAQDLGLESIAPLAGVSYAPENNEPGLIAGLTADFGEMIRNIEIYPGLSYWYAKKNEHKRSAFQFSIDGKYFFAPSSGFYTGCGVSVNRTTEEKADNPQKETRFQPGGAVFIGNEQFTARYIWFLQLKLDFVSDYKAISLSTGLFFDIYR
jgi:hypothetical protein